MRGAGRKRWRSAAGGRRPARGTRVAGRKRGLGPYAFTYNNANRLKTATASANLLGTYTYNGLEQLMSRVVANSGGADGTTHFLHDLWGNVIAELDSSGATVREYVWLIEAEIAPTRQSRAQVDLPLAVVDGVNTGSPAIYMVHADHLARPIRMTDASKAAVWEATYTPPFRARRPARGTRVAGRK